MEELTDRYGELPEPAQRLVGVARLRLLCRGAGITEVTAPSAATVRLSPMTLLDSAQVRLKRMYPAAQYRATTATVQVPIPRAGGVGAPRIRDGELVQMVANLVTALEGKAQQEIGITSSLPLDDDAGRGSARGGVGQSGPLDDDAGRGSARGGVGQYGRAAMSSEERQAR